MKPSAATLVPDAGSARHRVLDAAFRVAQRSGVMAVTLEAVAAEAGVSKGGLLYHFPSKDALLRGMVADLTERFVERIDTAAAADRSQVGRSARAYLEACLGDRDDAGRWLALIGALVRNPRLLAPWLETARNWRRDDRAENSDPVATAIVRLAADGLWLSDLLGAPPMPTAFRSKVVARLRQLSKEAE